MRKRNARGQFISNDTPMDGDKEEEPTERNGHYLMNRNRPIRTIFWWLGFIVIISPWLFATIKNGILWTVSNAISSFYEESFSCSCPNVPN